MKKIILLLLLFVGCATMKELTPSQKTYMEKTHVVPLTFLLAKSDIDAWGRAQSFIAKYSGMKIQTATDFVIDTYNPTASLTSTPALRGYKISRAPIGDNYEYTVQCLHAGNDWGLSQNQQVERDIEDAHIFAYYVKTGEIMPECLY